MTHRGLRRRLSAYLEGELAPGPRRRAEAHLADCAPCRAELAALRQTLLLLRAQRGAAETAPDLLPQITRRLAAGEGAAPRSWLRRALRGGAGGLRGWGPPLAACAAALALVLVLDSVEIRVQLPWPAGLNAPKQAGTPNFPVPVSPPAEPGRTVAPPGGTAAPSLAALDSSAPANRPAAAPPGRPGAAPARPPAQSLATADAGQAQRGGRAQPFGAQPRQPRGPVWPASSQSPARAQPVALGQPQVVPRQEPAVQPALLQVLRCAGQSRGIGCRRLQNQWVNLALSNPSAFAARLEEIPAPAQARWLADLSRFAVRRGTALQVISRLRGAGDPRAERLAARFEQSAANSAQ